MTSHTLEADRPRTDEAPHAADGPRRRRHIGPAGTAARLVVGGALVGSVVWGHARSGPDLWAWVIGLVALPALTIAWQRSRAGRDPSRLEWMTGPLGHHATFAAFMALYLTSWYAPAISVLSDAALIFYGTTMLVAAGRGYAGCEVLAISNWVLRRDDQIGCLLFEPIDRVERPPGTEHR
jgi:hypothetical protein